MKFHQLLSAAVLVWTASTMAAPVKFELSGKVRSYLDLATSSYDDTWSGLSFTAGYTIDSANAETVNPYYLYSNSGCAQSVFGVCTLNFFTGAPVVTSWFIDIVGRRFESSHQPDWSESSELQNGPRQTGVRHERYSFVAPALGAEASLNSIAFQASAYGSGLSDGFEGAPDLGAATSAGISLISQSFKCIYTTQQCGPYERAGFFLDLGIDSWAGRSTDVPEPGSLPLVLLGLTVFVASRRRRRPLHSNTLRL